MKPKFYQAHHAGCQEDLPFWLEIVEGKDPILDLGCGTGRMTIPLAEAGHRVWGCDRDLAMLEIARTTLKKEDSGTRSRVRWLAADITRFRFNLPFQAALCTCNTYSTLDFNERDRLLSCLGDYLSSGGLFAFSVPNPYLLQELVEEDQPTIETIFQHPDTGEPVQVSSLIQDREEGIGWTWYYDQLQNHGEVERTTVEIVHSGSSREAYLQQLDAAGLQVSAQYGDYDFSPWDEGSPYLIVTAVKPD